MQTNYTPTTDEVHDELCINHWESALGTELCNCEYIEHVRKDEREKAAQRMEIAIEGAWPGTPAHLVMLQKGFRDAIFAARGGSVNGLDNGTTTGA